MPRMRRKCPPGLPVHVVQRGNNHQVCFASDADMKAYANWLHEGAFKFGVDVHDWVFMINHTHSDITDLQCPLLAAVRDDLVTTWR